MLQCNAPLVAVLKVLFQLSSNTVAVKRRGGVRNRQKEDEAGSFVSPNIKL